MNEPRHTLIIAEAGVNHNGDPENARKLVGVAAECGADFVKFQTFKAYECAVRDCPKVAYQQANDPTRESQFEMLERLELPFERFKDLFEYARQCGLQFISTPDGRESLEFLVSLGVKALKIGSGEVTNLPFLKMAGATGKPVILSTGMSGLGEVETAIEHLKAGGATDVTLMHCTTNYPVQPDETNLKAITTLQQAFGLPVGFSDHTEGCEAAIGAVTLGATVLEKHITLDRGMAGPDHQASMDPAAFASYVAKIRMIEKMLGSPQKKAVESELKIRGSVRRSLVAARSIKAGEIIESSMIDVKRVKSGISPVLFDKVQGRKILRNLEPDEPINWIDLGGMAR